MFSISFDATPVADGGKDEMHFAFAVPISPSAAWELSRLRLDGPTGRAETLARASTQTGPVPLTQSRRVGSQVEIRWDAVSAPMVMVRDAATGEVLAFGRNGKLNVPTRADRLEIHLSDGLSSQRVLLSVAP